MSEPFVGEIRIFAGNFAPKGWAFCNGQIMSVSQNTVLFSILGTQYGGDGKNTFALPNLQGQAPMHQGAGPGLTPRKVGGGVGTSAVSLTQVQMPRHGHLPQAVSGNGSAGQDAAGAVWAQGWNPGRGGQQVPTATCANAASVPMAPMSLAPVGGSQPHNNMQPYLGLSFIIALQGVYPARG